ncbi:MAG: phage major capsid protein [Peptococcaceae bacterium]|nr:phage major capsid protein [Peptococcaceae bacterium]
MLRQLMLSKKIEQRKASLAELLEKEQELKTRSEGLEAAIDEAKTDEEIALVEEEADKLESEVNDLDEKKGKLEGEISALEGELEQLNSKDHGTDERSVQEKRNINQGGEIRMRGNGFFKDFSLEQRSSFLAREDVKDFLANTRGLIGQQRAISGAELTIPEVMLDLLRDNLNRYSKLISKVRLKPVPGKARQNISGSIPEGVWIEAVGSLNELELKFNQVEVDGYKVGGFIPVPNATLEDSDLNLASEIMDALGQAIGLAVDKAILYGTGTKMPLGIATRLAQASKPSSWDVDAPDWTDLRTSNLLKINPSGMTAEAFFAALLLDLGVARPNYAIGGTFWAMNRKTKMALMSKAISFNAAGAIVAGMNNTMPIEGGEIIELDFVPDNDIIGGYGSLYLLAERAGAQLAASEHVRFIEDQTMFKGTARYDGMPVFGESFVIVNINNASATTTRDFQKDYANTELGALGVTSVAGTASGDTLITVTGAEVSGTTLGYKVAGKVVDVKSGDSNVGYTAFTTPDDITAATGKVITMVEFDANGRAIKVGSAQVVAKA